MKKLLALLLAIVLALPAISLAEQPVFRSYASNFMEGTDGWYARSAGEAAISAGNSMLTITGRTATWNSPGRDFPLQHGKKYKISTQVMQNTESSVEFMISVAHSKNGLESYENLGRAKAGKGAWTRIEAEYTPGEYDNYVLYVETVGHGTVDFSIRQFNVEMTEVLFDNSLPSLHQAFSDYFDVGVAMNRGQSNDKARMEFAARQFNIMTHENELKPDAVIDIAASKKLAAEDETAVAIRLDSAKPMLNFCQANNIKVHGHVLVWHSQTPEAFFHEGYDTGKPFVSREVMLGRMENYIRRVFEETEAQYPGVIVSWDVVNEAVADNSSNLRESNWTKVVGQDFVNRAFEYADKYAPEGVLLYYNDYSTPYEPKLTGICNLLQSLIADGTVDGYGFQCHYSTTTPYPVQVRLAFERIAAMGLRLRVSELDVGINSDNSINRTFQASRYAELFQIFMDFSDQLEAVQVWGLTDDRSWRGDEYPLLFDAKGSHKPAFDAILKLVQPAE